jgi:hypothetical protein
LSPKAIWSPEEITAWIGNYLGVYYVFNDIDAVYIDDFFNDFKYSDKHPFYVYGGDFLNDNDPGHNEENNVIYFWPSSECDPEHNYFSIKSNGLSLGVLEGGARSI